MRTLSMRMYVIKSSAKIVLSPVLRNCLHATSTQDRITLMPVVSLEFALSGAGH